MSNKFVGARRPVYDLSALLAISKSMFKMESPCGNIEVKSVKHREISRYNEVFLPTGYDVIVTSPPGGASDDFYDGF